MKTCTALTLTVSGVVCVLAAVLNHAIYVSLWGTINLVNTLLHAAWSVCLSPVCHSVLPLFTAQATSVLMFCPASNMLQTLFDGRIHHAL